MIIKFKSLPERLISPLVVNKKGSILIIVLWSVCFLSSFAVIVGLETRQKIQVVQRLDERDRLYLIAGTGIKKGIAKIKDLPLTTYDSFSDSCADDSVSFRDVGFSGGSFDIGYILEDGINGKAGNWYGLIDEGRKININRANRITLEKLFKIVLDFDEIDAQELAASIIDWRDADSELTIPIGSAEDSYYRNLTHPYEAKDAPFEVLDEILLVKGMNEAVFTKLKDYITIYGDGRVNVNTASKPVLLAVGLNLELVEKILSYRYGKDEILNTSDDNIFDIPTNIIPKLSQSYSLSDSEVAQLSTVADQFLCTDANYFMIKIKAGLNNRKNSLEAISVVDRKGNILYWHES